jgi:hypothetical protein
MTVAIDQSAGPPKWKVSTEADATVILYEKLKVTRKYALRRGELTAETIDMIVADVSTFLGR